jgi:hypothetical protein
MRANVRAGFKPALLTILITLCMAAPQASQASKRIESKVRFAPVHVYLDPGGRPLAAYQFELVCSVPVGAYSSADEEDNASRRHYERQIKIVGVEGGAHPAFQDAPYYDPAALMNERIIIAAFNTGANLPTTRTRIATIHLQILGDAEPKYELSLTTAADANGENLPVRITLEKGEQK